MATRQNAEEPALLSYIVTQDRGEFVIQVQANWKLTFGAVNPGGGQVGRHDLHCLRVWEGEKLRAVFCDVRGFRDLSLPLIRKVSKQTGSAEWVQDSEGNYEKSSRAEITSTFVDETVDPQDIPF